MTSLSLLAGRTVAGNFKRSKRLVVCEYQGVGRETTVLPYNVSWNKMVFIVFTFNIGTYRADQIV